MSSNTLPKGPVRGALRCGPINAAEAITILCLYEDRDMVVVAARMGIDRQMVCRHRFTAEHRLGKTLFTSRGVRRKTLIPTLYCERFIETYGPEITDLRNALEDLREALEGLS